MLSRNRNSVVLTYKKKKKLKHGCHALGNTLYCDLRKSNTPLNSFTMDAFLVEFTSFCLCFGRKRVFKGQKSKQPCAQKQALL